MNPLISLALLAALSDPIPVADATGRGPVSYAREVSEILASKCVGCHNAGLPESKLLLEDVASIRKGGKRGPALEPGDAGASLILRLASRRDEPGMPPVDQPEHPPMTSAELGLLKRWIDDGARDDSAEMDAATAEIGILPAGLHPILAVDMSADGRLVAFGRGAEVVVHDAESGLRVARLGGHRDAIQSIRFSPDGRKLAAGSYQDVTIWLRPDEHDPEPGPWELWRTLGPHADRVLALDFSPDGRQLAAGSGEPSLTGELTIWGLDRAEPLARFEGIHSDAILGLRFRPDGKALATSSADRFVKVVELPSGNILASMEGHNDHVLSVDWDAEGKLVASGGADGAVKVWDAAAGEVLRSSQGDVGQVSAIRWMGAGDDARIVAACGDGSVRVWIAASLLLDETFEEPGGFLYGVAAADRSRVAAGGAEGVLLYLDARDGSILRKLGGASDAP